LSEAWDANSHVPAYLIGKKKLPKRPSSLEAVKTDKFLKPSL
jgi:hypothetical protein